MSKMLWTACLHLSCQASAAAPVVYRLLASRHPNATFLQRLGVVVAPSSLPVKLGAPFGSKISPDG